MRVAVIGVLLWGTVAAAQAPPSSLQHCRPVIGSNLMECDYDGGPLPANAHVEERSHESLMLASLSLGIGVYLLNDLSTLIGDLYCLSGCQNQDYRWLYLPFAGPIILAALPSVQQSPAAAGLTALLVTDAAVQIGAVAFAFIAKAWQSKVVVVSVGTRGAPAGLTVTTTF